MAEEKGHDLRRLERELYAEGLGPVAGVDEAGRGACAGPMTIAACALPDEDLPELSGLDDSKKLTPARREALYPKILEAALAWSVVMVPAGVIDRVGVHVANLEGMRRAVERLDLAPGFVLTDGFRVPDLPAPSLAVTKGDARVRCIAAASVIAKVSRDRTMAALGGVFPGYGLERHKGYGTAQHAAAVRLHGPTPIHRYTYSNVAVATEAWRADQAPGAAGAGEAPTTDSA